MLAMRTAPWMIRAAHGDLPAFDDAALLFRSRRAPYDRCCVGITAGVSKETRNEVSIVVTWLWLRYSAAWQISGVLSTLDRTKIASPLETSILNLAVVLLLMRHDFFHKPLSCLSRNAAMQHQLL